MVRVGLRVDVDTLRGACVGAPNLVALMEDCDVRATFFYSVGPDNMGRHLSRLLRPAFLAKMLRTQAASLYGWDILFRGTLGPGPVIGERCRSQIEATAKAGHEVGLHAWDHHWWQKRIADSDKDSADSQIRKGFDLLTDILGKAPVCFAAPAWRVTDEALIALGRFPFRFQSDCRGHSIFRPLIRDRLVGRSQVPTTLPTYDETVGLKCRTDQYNEFLLDLLRPDHLNVLTIHAEAEGIGCLDLFQDFLAEAKRRGVVFGPLGELVSKAENIAASRVERGTLDGRQGWCACQGKT